MKYLIKILATLVLSFYAIISLAAHMGTGFFVNPNGYIVTVAHVAKHANLIAYYKGLWYPIKIICIDNSHDLAILKIEAKKTPYLTLDTGPVFGKSISVYGYPCPDDFGWQLKYSNGKAWNIGETTYTTAIICPGNSGSPIMSNNGVVGIVASSFWWARSGKYKCADFNSGSCSIELLNLLKHNNVPYYVTQNTHYKLNDAVVILLGD